MNPRIGSLELQTKDLHSCVYMDTWTILLALWWLQRDPKGNCTTNLQSFFQSLRCANYDALSLMITWQRYPLNPVRTFNARSGHYRAQHNKFEEWLSDDKTVNFIMLLYANYEQLLLIKNCPNCNRELAEANFVKKDNNIQLVCECGFFSNNARILRWQ